MKTVTVTVVGGVIQHVELPDDVRVVVHDYDVDGVEDERIEKDDNGDRRIVLVWD